jgi:hypothetical protein
VGAASLASETRGGTQISGARDEGGPRLGGGEGERVANVDGLDVGVGGADEARSGEMGEIGASGGHAGVPAGDEEEEAPVAAN